MYVHVGATVRVTSLDGVRVFGVGASSMIGAVSVGAASMMDISTLIARITITLIVSRVWVKTDGICIHTRVIPN